MLNNSGLPLGRDKPHAGRSFLSVVSQISRNEYASALGCAMYLRRNGCRPRRLFNRDGLATGHDKALINQRNQFFHIFQSPKLRNLPETRTVGSEENASLAR